MGISKGHHRTASLALLLVAVQVFVSGSYASAADTTTAAEIEVWSVNLHIKNEMSEPRGTFFAKRLNQADIRPDIILVQEIPHKDAAEFSYQIDELQADINNRIGPGYNYKHAGLNSNNAIIWRSTRFDLVESITWQRFGAGDPENDEIANCIDYSDPDDPAPIEPGAPGRGLQIAVELKDKLHNPNKAVAAASVHFPGIPNDFERDDCMQVNFARMEDKLEALVPGVRWITAIGGDFNASPQDFPRGDEMGTADSTYRYEMKQDCWYRRTLYLNSTVTAWTPCKYPSQWTPNLQKPPSSMAYFDTVAVRHHRTEDLGNPTASICRQWTHPNNDHGARDRCDEDIVEGRAPTRRIDYIATSWENADDWTLGGSGTSSKWITRAQADPIGYPDDDPTKTYSDHRAVRATIKYGPETGDGL